MIPEYLKNNINRIKNNLPQKLPPWDASYEYEVYKKFPIFNKLKKIFPKKTIQRNDVIHLFKSRELYLGFVAAMMWGGINASRDRGNGGKTNTNFYLMLDHPEGKVLNAINYAYGCFQKGDMESPFNEMLPSGKYRIPGVGPSYFTKMFFFIGQSHEKIITKPIIFDKWTKNAFFALLTQSFPDEIRKYFLKVRENEEQSKPGEVVLRSDISSAKVYTRFVELFNKWAIELNVFPDKLEEFVFGWSLKNKRENNPRIELWDIIVKNRQLALVHKQVKCLDSEKKKLKISPNRLDEINPCIKKYNCISKSIVNNEVENFLTKRIPSYKDWIKWMEQNLSNQTDVRNLGGKMAGHQYIYDSSNQHINIYLNNGKKGKQSEKILYKIFNRFMHASKSDRYKTSFYNDPQWNDSEIDRIYSPYIPSLICCWLYCLSLK